MTCSPRHTPKQGSFPVDGIQQVVLDPVAFLIDAPAADRVPGWPYRPGWMSSPAGQHDRVGRTQLGLQGEAESIP